MNAKLARIPLNCSNREVGGELTKPWDKGVNVCFCVFHVSANYHFSLFVVRNSEEHHQIKGWETFLIEKPHQVKKVYWGYLDKVY